MRTSEGWDQLHIESKILGVSLSQACRSVGIRPARFKHYLTGCVVPERGTVDKIAAFFRGVRERRKVFYAIS